MITLWILTFLHNSLHNYRLWKWNSAGFDRNIFFLVCFYLNFLLTHLKILCWAKGRVVIPNSALVGQTLWEQICSHVSETLVLKECQGLIIVVHSWHTTAGSWLHLKVFSIIFLHFTSFWSKIPLCPSGYCYPQNTLEDFWINLTKHKDLWFRLFYYTCTDFHILTAQSKWQLLWLDQAKRKGGEKTF